MQDSADIPKESSKKIFVLCCTVPALPIVILIFATKKFQTQTTILPQVQTQRGPQDLAQMLPVQLHAPLHVPIIKESMASNPMPFINLLSPYFYPYFDCCLSRKNIKIVIIKIYIFITTFVYNMLSHVINDCILN